MKTLATNHGELRTLSLRSTNALVTVPSVQVLMLLNVDIGKSELLSGINLQDSKPKDGLFLVLKLVHLLVPVLKSSEEDPDSERMLRSLDKSTYLTIMPSRFLSLSGR